jgi:dipeptidyl aminopeptidase/acylaminoacyl peptidase
MKKEGIEFVSSGAKIKGLISFPEGIGERLPGIILCHGFTNSKTECPMIQSAADMLVESGFATLQFDFFGSGESDGIFRDKTVSIMIQNLEDAIPIFLRHARVNPERIGIWGRSIGGSVALTQAEHPSVKAFCLASPLSNFSGFFAKLNKDLNSEYVLMPTSIEHGNIKGPWEINQRFFSEFNFIDKRIEHLARSCVTPTCIFQGDSDDKVLPADTREFLRKLNGPKQLVMVNAGHDYKGAEEEVLIEMLAWFSNYV